MRRTEPSPFDLGRDFKFWKSFKPGFRKRLKRLILFFGPIIILSFFIPPFPEWGHFRFVLYFFSLISLLFLFIFFGAILRLPDYYTCGRCKKIVSRYDKLCGNCGVSLSDDMIIRGEKRMAKAYFIFTRISIPAFFGLYVLVKSIMYREILLEKLPGPATNFFFELLGIFLTGGDGTLMLSAGLAGFSLWATDYLFYGYGK